LFAAFIRSANWTTNDRFYVIDDQLCVNRLIRYEHLNDDFREVCTEVGVPPIELPRLKGGFRSSRRHYSEYYDDQTADIVAKRHRNDLRLLGYEFERP
jgi:hypothetical protein